MRSMVRSSFKAQVRPVTLRRPALACLCPARRALRSQMHVTDPTEISKLKMLAIVGIQNYVIHEQTGTAVESRRGGDSGGGPG